MTQSAREVAIICTAVCVVLVVGGGGQVCIPYLVKFSCLCSVITLHISDRLRLSNLESLLNLRCFLQQCQ